MSVHSATMSFAGLLALMLISASLGLPGKPRMKRSDDENDGNEEEEYGNEEEDAGVVVNTLLGAVKGAEFVNQINGEIFLGFQGIPYGEAPVGKLRFMPPEPKRPWEGVLDATEEPEMCMQIDIISQSPKGTEDCLKLSIFTPKYPEEVVNSPMPVIVFIHGGAFNFGHYSMDYGPDYLMTQEVVFVAIYYRLGAFGFLSFQDDVLPGNAGMKDQVLALKWIRANIAVFGGDPNKVTLFGVSAGATSTLLHTLSPLSKGLFHNAIASSGTAVAFWAMSKGPGIYSSILADVYNCSREGSAAVLECLQAPDAYDFTLAQMNAIPVERAIEDAELFPLSPCVEPANASGAFLTEDPYDASLRDGPASVPLMVGINEAELGQFEALLLCPMIPLKYRKQALKMLGESDIIGRVPVGRHHKMTKKMVDDISDFYFKGEKFSLDNLNPIVEFASDAGFEVPMYETVSMQLKQAKYPVYQYMATINTNYSLVRHVFFFAPYKGVSHGDFVGSYVLFYSKNTANPDHPGQKVALRTAAMFANFARTGNPTPDDALGVRWLPVEPNHRYFLNINETFTVEEDMHYDRMKFWTNLLDGMP